MSQGQRVGDLKQSAHWTAIVCTCQNRESANAFRKELQIRHKKGLICSSTVILAVDDPKPNIGSGSATLNALISVTECLAAREGHKVMTAEVLQNARVLILLLGATFPFSPCGHAFMPAPNGPQEEDNLHTEVTMNIDQLMEDMEKLSERSPAGVWVASTDMILKHSSPIEPLDMSDMDNSVGALTVEATPEHAMKHGACKINESGEISCISHMGPKDVVESWTKPDGTCDMLAGIVYLSPGVSKDMVDLHTSPPLDACTYFGLDNGAQPLSLSLFFDILLCMTADIKKDDFVSGQFRTSSGPSDVMTGARALLWKTFHGTKMKAVPLKGVEHDYLRHVAKDVCNRYDKSVINSKLSTDRVGPGSVVINCHLQRPIEIKANCFLSGVTDSFLDLQSEHAPVHIIPEGVAVQEIKVAMGTLRQCFHLDVGMVYGINDILTANEDSKEATFCNKPWSEFFERTKIQRSELWPTTPHTLLTAKLYVASHTDPEGDSEHIFWLASGSPSEETLLRWRSAWRVSLMDILRCVDCEAEFKKCRDIAFQLQQDRMVSALKNNQPVCFLPFFKHSLVEKREHELLATLDDVVQEVTDKPLVICRIYACIADILGFMAGEEGIRGGPAANIAWKTAFSLLEKENYLAATRALAAERQIWINGGSDRIIRASRHYERAGQYITRIGVATAKEFISGSPCNPPPIDQDVVVTAPARIDIAGGWTDTPPQAYEWGGVVVTLAIKINNENPIKCIATRIKSLKLVLLQRDSEGEEVKRIEITELSQMLDYSQPHAPGALLKAAFICAGIVEVRSTQSLADQLSRYRSGFKLETIAKVPQGSGLGTSSILGGAIMAALWKATGEDHTKDSLIHAVLHLEQLLTTGGGWQDQCGGLYGGAKKSSSDTGLPVKISTQQIVTPLGFTSLLSDHLMLIYTGRTRLARNLLQDVLRNWHSRDSKIISTMTDLVANALKAADAFKDGKLEVIGSCLNKYREQKLIMAPGSLPKSVKFFIEKTRDYLHGCSLTGAGGGGFLAAIVKTPKDKQKVEDIITTSPELRDFTTYRATVDESGLVYDQQ